MDPAVRVADLTDLRHFPAHEVAEAEFLKVAFLVQGVDFAQRVYERGVSVRAVQVVQVDFSGPESLQALHERFADVGWPVRPVGGVDVQACSGVDFGGEGEPALGVVELAQVRFGAALAVEPGGVDLGMTVRLEYVQHLAAI